MSDDILDFLTGNLKLRDSRSSKPGSSKTSAKEEYAAPIEKMSEVSSDVIDVVFLQFTRGDYYRFSF